MDGRVQLPVIEYLQSRFNVQYVDTITEAGPNLILAEQNNTALLHSILERLKISIEHHHSKGIAIVGHYDCAKNPASREDQIVHISNAIKFVRQIYPDIEIIGLWVDENWRVFELSKEQLNA
jgi:carbonic anhydrase